jgi:hypothetical protein
MKTECASCEVRTGLQVLLQIASISQLTVSRLSRQCGILNISQPYRPPRPVAGELYFTYLLTTVTSFIIHAITMTISAIQAADLLHLFSEENHACMKPWIFSRWQIIFLASRDYDFLVNLHVMQSSKLIREIKSYCQEMWNDKTKGTVEIKVDWST